MSSRIYRNVKGTVALLADGNRQTINLDNRVQSGRLVATIAGILTVAGAPAGAVRNRGLLSSAIQLSVVENGRDTFGLARARVLRAIAERMAGQALPATALPASGALPIGVYPLRETFEIAFNNRLAVDPWETAYMEADPGSFFSVDALMTNNAIACLVAVGGATVTLTGVTVTIEQVADPARGTLPLFTPNYREQVQTVAGANPADLFYIKSRSRLRSLIFAPEAQTADGGVVEAPDVITALRLIGDDGRNIIGPTQTPWLSLVNDEASNTGGLINPAYLFVNFQDNGRLTSTIVPSREYPNFRAEFADQLSALGVTSRIVCGITELTRTPPLNGYATVAPELPAWLA